MQIILAPEGGNTINSLGRDVSSKHVSCSRPYWLLRGFRFGGSVLPPCLETFGDCMVRRSHPTAGGDCLIVSPIR